MTTKTEFINKWKCWWMLQKQGVELTSAFEKELNLIIEQEVASKNLAKADVSGSVAYPKVSKLLAALNDIRNWDDDLEDEWEDAGYRAKAALAEYYKATDR